MHAHTFFLYLKSNIWHFVDTRILQNRKNSCKMLTPATFNWNKDAIGWYQKFHYVFLTAAILYYPVIFGIQHYMKDKVAFDLGGAATTVGFITVP